MNGSVPVCAGRGTSPVSGTQSLESETPPLLPPPPHRDIAETIRQTLTDTELPNGRRPYLAVFSRQIADLLKADCRRSVTSGFDRELTAFTFLGFTFRARAARTKHATMFVSFQPAISKDAQNKDQRSDPPLAAAPQDRAHPRRSRR